MLVLVAFHNLNPATSIWMASTVLVSRMLKNDALVETNSETSFVVRVVANAFQRPLVTETLLLLTMTMRSALL